MHGIILKAYNGVCCGLFSINLNYMHRKPICGKCYIIADNPNSNFNTLSLSLSPFVFVSWVERVVASRQSNQLFWLMTMLQLYKMNGQMCRFWYFKIINHYISTKFCVLDTQSVRSPRQSFIFSIVHLFISNDQTKYKMYLLFLFAGISTGDRCYLKRYTWRKTEMGI